MTLNSLTAVDARTANVAIVNQGLDPGVAGQMMNAQQHAIRSEAMLFTMNCSRGNGKLWWVKLEITSPHRGECGRPVVSQEPSAQ